MSFGFEGVQDAMEAARARAAASGYLPDIYWTDDRATGGDKHIQVVRFIPGVDEEGVSHPKYALQTHGFYNHLVINDGQSKRHFIKPKEGPDYVAENVKVMRRGNLVAPTPRVLTAALAVLREEYRNTVDGQTHIGYRDKRRRASQGGQPDDEPMFGIVCQSQSNFWCKMQEYYEAFGTICDRDYLIERYGNDKTTTYTITPCAPDPELDTDEKVLARYAPPVTLNDWVRELSSQERAANLLGQAADGSKAPEVQPGFVPRPPQQEQMQGYGYPGYGMPPQPGYGYQQPQYGGYQQPQYGQMPPQYGQMPPQQAYNQQQPYQQQYGQMPPQQAAQRPPQGYGQPPAGYGPPQGQPQPQQYGNAPRPQQAPQQQYQPQAQPQPTYQPPQPPQQMPGGFNHAPADVNQGAPQAEMPSQNFDSLRNSLLDYQNQQQ